MDPAATSGRKQREWRAQLRASCSITLNWKTAANTGARRSKGIAEPPRPLTEQNPLLPPEVLDLVIDNLHGDIPTLRSCSLLCHAFVSTARYHLFDTVLINPRNARAAKTMIIDKLPHLLKHTRHITLEVLDDTQVEPSTRVREFFSGQGLKSFANTFIYDIISLAPNVEHLGFKDIPLDQTTIDALTIAFPQLNTLTVFDCWFRCNADFYTLIHSHPLIHTLRVGRVSSLFGIAPLALSPSIGSPISLVTLKISEAYSPSPLTMMPWLTAQCHAQHFVYTLYRLLQIVAFNNCLFGMASVRHLHIIFYRWRSEGESDDAPIFNIC